MLNLSAAADILHVAEPTTPAGYFIVQIRDLLAKGALTVPRSGTGRTAGFIFTTADICKLRLLGILQRAGLAPDVVRSAGVQLDSFDDGKDESGIGRVLDGVRRGEDWYFHLHTLTAPQPTAGAWSRDPSAATVKPLRALTMLTVTLDGLALLRPILAAADAAED